MNMNPARFRHFDHGRFDWVRVAIQCAGDIAELLWHAILLAVVCTGLGWIGWQVHLSILYGGGSEIAAVVALGVVSTAAFGVAIEGAVRISRKFERQRNARRASRTVNR